MSTRGTYKIYDGYNDLDVYFYVHHDNYPEGAAEKFKNMLTMVDEAPYGWQYGPCFGYAAAFFRANEGARFTKNHRCHGDTEYQYNIVKEDNNSEEIRKGTVYLEAFEVRRNWKKYNEDFAKLNKDPTNREQDVYPHLQTRRIKFFQGTIEDFIKKYTEQEKVEERKPSLTLVKS